MGSDVEEAVATILAVADLDERALLLARMEASMHAEAPGQGAVGAAWRAEVESRVEEILNGKVDLVDADETYRLLSAELAVLRE